MAGEVDKKSDKRPVTVVGIAGASGSGKSWLAGRLRRLAGEGAVELSLDAFYRDRSHLSAGRRARVNFDHPRAIDWGVLEGVLETWRRGEGARVPIYDFASHQRTGATEERQPAGLVILEGLWLLRRPAVRRLLDLKVYLRCPEAVCLQRRVERDMRERGRTEESVRRQYLRVVAPMQRRFVESQERWADVVLDGPLDEPQVVALAERILGLREGSGARFGRATPAGRKELVLR